MKRNRIVLFALAALWAVAQDLPLARTQDAGPISRSRAGQVAAPRSESSSEQPFVFEALVDFPDDVLTASEPITPQHLDGLMRQLKELGVQRVSWGYYGDGHGGMLCPADYSEAEQGNWKNYEATYRGLGNPLKVAVEAGHRHGLEVYAYFKPYETGPALIFPEGSPQAKAMGRLPHLGGQLAWLDPFVKAHPHLRIKRRTDDLTADIDAKAVRTIRLVKNGDSPTRITKEHLQIWTSEANWRYQRKQVDFQFADSVEKNAHDGAGKPVRVLTLSGLNLTDKYILVTTDFTEGDPDFVNSGLELMTALDGDGREIPGTVATGGAVWCSNLQNFRKQGLTYDYGFGGAPVPLDAANANGRQGIIAFTRGRNAHLPGALCETEPEVQAFWLRCLDEMIAAGVDGVDFREENHSTHTDHPKDYGFNEVILRQCSGLSGRPLLDKVAQVRGNAYTAFLSQCRARLGEAKKKMRYNLQVDWFRPERPTHRELAYPAHVDWQWRTWIENGLMDEAILRFYAYQPKQILVDPVVAEMLTVCKENSLPVTFNRYLSHAGKKLPGEVTRVQNDGRFSGFILYETYDFIRFAPNGVCSLSGRPEVVESLRSTTFKP